MEGGGLAEALEADAAPAAGLPAFTAFGIELEYMLVDRGTLDVRAVADRVLQRLGGEPGRPPNDVVRGSVGWSNELVLHLLELKNQRPTADLAALAPRFQSELGAVQPLLRDLGVRLMPGGMHPWMNPRAETALWPHEGRGIYRAYDRVFDCRRHGWANLQAMHVNLPFADDAEFARLHAAVRVLLPLVPAIAASSPFADGRATGALDSRMEAYRTNSDRVPALTGALVPDNYSSRRQYQSALLAGLYRAIAPHDPDRLLRQEWLNSRGAIARFDRCAIEIRVADVQEHPGMDLAIAALLADLAWWLCGEHGPAVDEQRALDTGPLSVVLQACSREAEQARLDHVPLLRLFGETRDSCSAGELWRTIGTLLERANAPHRALWSSPLQRILEHGPLARRLLVAAGPAPDRSALAEVYARLCDCLDDGRDFVP